jgi:hypothetical protein
MRSAPVTDLGFYIALAALIFGCLALILLSCALIPIRSRVARLERDLELEIQQLHAQVSALSYAVEGKPLPPRDVFGMMIGGRPYTPPPPPPKDTDNTKGGVPRGWKG